ncbi:MAG: (Fe-S)-binding protein [Planctomycetota bacterium]
MQAEVIDAGKANDPASPEARYGYRTENSEGKDRVARFLEAFAAVLEYTDYRPLLESYCSSSAKCNRCATSCAVFLATGDPKDIPCYRTSLLLNTYKRYFTLGGWMKSRFTSGFELTEEVLDDIANVFYRCTACRRCTAECPMGVDHGLITRLGRYVLSLMGIVPKALQVSVREQLEGETHNTSKIPAKALVHTLEFLAEEMEENLGVSVEFPVDQPDREFVFFCAVSDYLLEPDTLIGNAAVIHAAGDWDRWTIGSGNFDGINYGLFYSDWHLERIIKRQLDEVERLRAQCVLVGECGHASRTAHDFIPVFSSKRGAPRVMNFM